jgi:hypothetical protein
MSIPRLQILSLVFALSAFAGALGASPDDSENEPYQEGGIYYGCGKPRPIDGYEITFQGTRLLLPRLVQILDGSTTLFIDDKPTPWIPPYSEAKYAIVGDLLLIVTEQNDCIDLQTKRLFILKNHQVLLHQRIWTNFYRDGFYLDEGVLRYWSEYFCSPASSDWQNGRTFAYALAKDSTAFERVEVDEAHACGPGDERQRIEFHEPTLLSN